MPDCPKCGFNPDKQFRDSGLAKLIKMLESGTIAERGEAAAELGTRGDPGAVEPLIAALDSPSDSVVLPALIALGRIRDARAVGPLIRLLKRGDDRAAESLAKIGTLEAIRAVTDALGSLKYQRDVYMVLDALAERGENAVDGLIRCLDAGDAYIREQVSQRLGRIGDRRAVEPLTRLLRKENNQQVRRAAAKACAELGCIPSDPDDA